MSDDPQTTPEEPETEPEAPDDEAEFVIEDLEPLEDPRGGAPPATSGCRVPTADEP